MSRLGLVLLLVGAAALSSGGPVSCAAEPPVDEPPATVPASSQSSSTAKDSAATSADAAPTAPPAADPSTEDLLAFARVLERAYAQTTPPEAVRMLIAIAHGSQMGPGEGWFGPGQSRYDWRWFAQSQHIAPDGSLPSAAFAGERELFRRLDRDRDGQISASDFDWSNRNSFLQQSAIVTRLFRRIDESSDSRLTRNEWLAFFDRVSPLGEPLRLETLRDTLIGGPSGFAPGDAPRTDVLIRGLFRGEIGSLNEGPGIDEPAPDFRLKTHDGAATIRLSEQLGDKPIVLVFGNFTCGPFRLAFPLVEELHARYRTQAAFLAVYVREAHPRDGWQMAANARQGVDLPQPRNYAERVSVAQQCQLALRYSMPLLVDEIHDPVGNAYSGMPARLYLIDAAGKIAYKSGRGPFGFQVGELEQALLLSLLERSMQAAAPQPSTEPTSR